MEAQARWDSEARFFDRVAERVAARLERVDEATLERYRAARRPWFNKEFRFQCLGDLRGRHVLDVGCGEGTNTVLLARLGAQVTGIDVSPRSIEVSRRRAELEGVSGQVQLMCSPLEVAELPEARFDVVWVDGVLHHVLPVLEQVLERLVRWARPGALFVISEPVNLAPWLRRLRQHLPIHTDATPGERPLERAELELVERLLPGLERRSFGLLSWLGRLLLAEGYNYERSSRPRQQAVELLARADQVLLGLPGLYRLGSMLVLHGRPRS